MPTIVLGKKGSATSGNVGHAGRPGAVGGSRPKNYGAAMTGWTALGSPAIPHPDTLNRGGLQAIIDHSNGQISWNSMMAAVNDPANQKGSKNPTYTTAAAAQAAVPAPPAPAPTPPAATPPAPTPPPTPPVPPTVTTTDAMTVFNSWPYKYRHAFPTDVNSLNDKGLQAIMDMKAGKITPADMYKIVQDPSAHKGGVVAPPPWQAAKTAQAAQAAAAPPPAPPPPPPPPKDARFYQGDVTGKSANELYAGSSKEVQDLARKTGIVATDQASLDYIKANQSRFEREMKYPPSFDKYLNNQPPHVANQAGNALNNMDSGKPSSSGVIYHMALIKGDAAGGHATLTPKEQAVVDKAAQLHNDATDKYNQTYRSGKGWMAADTAQMDVLKAGWANMTSDEKKTMGDLMQRRMAAAWVNSNVPYTMTGATKYSNPPNWKDLRIENVPSTVASNADVKRLGWDHRNSLMKRPQPNPYESGYKPTETLALSSLSKTRMDAVKAKIEADWDHQQHQFSGTVEAAFNIHPQKAVTDNYNKIATARDNVVQDLYHGTHYEAAVLIASNGYKVFPASQAKAGRAMGDGIYLADKSSKSAQYIHGGASGSTWGSSRSGVLFLNTTSKGVEQVHGGYSYTSSSANTIFGPKGYWRNNEWCVKDAAAVLPTMWLDIKTQ